MLVPAIGRAPITCARNRCPPTSSPQAWPGESRRLHNHRFVFSALINFFFLYSLDNFLTEVVGEPGRAQNRQMIFLLGGVCWVLWKTRNDWVFNDILISKPNALAYRIVGYLQHRCGMAARKDQEGRQALVERLKDGAQKT
jgi:hypothetical protein